MTDRDDPSGHEEDESKKNGEQGLASSRWEWVAACIGFVLVAGAIGFLLREGLGSPATPPEITVEVDSILPAGSGFLVEFHARNDGGRTASALQIEGVLRVSAEEEEVSSVTLDYLPPESERSAGLFFSHDPRLGELEIRPTGYQRP